MQLKHKWSLYQLHFAYVLIPLYVKWELRVYETV